MKKLKWYYHKERGEWRAGSLNDSGNPMFRIEKHSLVGGYFLYEREIGYVSRGYFRKFKSAKQVAHLIQFG